MGAPFLKMGTDQQTHETDKRFRSEGAIDISAGEVVEVSVEGAEGSGSHRIPSPQGAVIIGRALDDANVVVNWQAASNTIAVTLNGATTGTITFLVF